MSVSLFWVQILHLCFHSFLLFLGVASWVRQFLIISSQNFFCTLNKSKNKEGMPFLEPSFSYQGVFGR